MNASSRKFSTEHFSADERVDSRIDDQQRDHPDRSAERYAERSRVRRRLNRGDWWIALATYLLMGSFAILIF